MPSLSSTLYCYGSTVNIEYAVSLATKHTREARKKHEPRESHRHRTIWVACFHPTVTKTIKIRLKMGIFDFAAEKIHWFPSHMRQGMDGIKKLLAKTDIVLEVRDSRMSF